MGIRPLATAAIATRCFGYNSTSVAASPPISMAKSSEPRLMAISRGWAAAISSARAKAAGVSISAISLVWPMGMPSAASRRSTSSASRRIWPALSIFGSISVWIAGDTAASMSRTASSIGWLMRTTTSAPLLATLGAAAAINVACRGLFGRWHAVLEIEDYRVRTPRVRSLDELRDVDGHEQQRAQRAIVGDWVIGSLYLIYQW